MLSGPVGRALSEASTRDASTEYGDPEKLVLAVEDVTNKIDFPESAQGQHTRRNA
jgi:hypothetical protein